MPYFSTPGGEPVTKEYVAYLAYRKGRKPPEIPQDPVYTDFLMHYGVQGMHWGERRWQLKDGTYTEEGKHHYGWGYGRQITGQNGGINPGANGSRANAKVDGYQPQRLRTGTRTATSQPQKRQVSEAEIEARKAQIRKILGIAAGVAVAAALSYAAYRGSTKLRDNMREDMIRTMSNDHSRINSLNSKYWDSSDRVKYSELSRKRAQEAANNLTRTEAVAARFGEKTGLRINVPQSRQRQLAERRSSIEFERFYNSAEKRGALNKSIHDARQELKAQQKSLTRYRDTSKIGTSKQYEDFWVQRRQEQVDAARERLNNLLQQRRAG